MKDYELTIENGILLFVSDLEGSSDEGNDLGKNKCSPGRLYIPECVTEIHLQALIGIDPTAVDVEDGNPMFFSRDNCLISREDGTLLFGCKRSKIPDDGSVRSIGQFAFHYIDEADREFDEMIVPASVCHVGFMALAISTKEKGCVFSFRGSPTLEPGAFGTKAEAAGVKIDSYKKMPDNLYCDSGKIMIRGKAGSTVETYCKQYGICFAPFRDVKHLTD